MTKYVVCTETIEIPVRYTYGGLQIEDIMDYYYEKMWDHDPDDIASFDTLEEAKAFYEKEKEKCETTIMRSSGISYYYVEICYYLCREYDEDGEYITESDWYDYYAKPYIEEDELDDDDDI